VVYFPNLFCFNGIGGGNIICMIECLKGVLE
jgi:hypothetical protein